MTELKVTSKSQFRAIQWTGNNHDEVCKFFGVNPNNKDKLNRIIAKVRFGDYFLFDRNSLRLLTIEQFNERYEVVNDTTN